MERRREHTPQEGARQALGNPRVPGVRAWCFNRMGLPRARLLTLLRALLLLGICGLSPRAEADARAYIPLRKHTTLFDARGDLPLEWFDKQLRPHLRAAGSSQPVDAKDVRQLMTVEADGVFSFPLFTPEFCRMFLEELDNYKASGLPVRRPNSMNRYGLIVNGIGMRDRISQLQRIVLQPVASLLFPVEGSHFDSHHSFMVQYRQGQDTGLDMHTDDSDVTFNVCLGKNFTGATLTICGMGGTPEHRQFAH